MEKTTISIIFNKKEQKLKILYDSARGSIKLTLPNKPTKLYEADDLYLCLAKIRDENPEITFLCKGAKLNVTPSRMCSQMSGGEVAYELQPGRSATFKNIVHIFDYEDKNLSNNPTEQKEFYIAWLNSLNTNQEG
ncbi:hypothetical protein KVG96_15710 [Pseudomonas sp. COR58]|uniref:Uncharacterized protein n=1 Tax=Pseudomonas ekonensis TaxID=2842353 RepID=A0ABS6PG41_9PSED|nr:hypothetical protein [Pseudomonas ekonensis]MBV4459400.1 hypothetical protein [Pseudomonas ekonensis]